MNEVMFNELMEAIKEMGAYLRGELPEDYHEVVYYGETKVLRPRRATEAPPSHPGADQPDEQDSA